jgi:hypothetical protein
MAVAKSCAIGIIFCNGYRKRLPRTAAGIHATIPNILFGIRMSNKPFRLFVQMGNV